MTTNFAAKHFGVPRTTLQYRLSTKCKHKGTTGPYPVFTTTEEQDIVSWLLTMERRGFPATYFALKYKISAFLAAHPRKTPFKDNVPGSGWFRGFLKRHPQLTIRTPEPVTSASAKVSEKNIREWFHTVKQYLIDHGLIDILLDPSRVYNGDESGFSLNPTSKSVIATAGARNVPIVETGNSKKNITVMFTFGADGSVVPPDVILAQKRLNEGCSGDELRQNTSGYEVTEKDEDNLLGTVITNNQIINAQQLNIGFTTSPDLTGKTDSHISTPEAPRLADFLDAPDVLKRSSKHVNYQMQSHAVLTADERLQAIILKENQRDEAERLKKEKAEQRALQKVKLEEQKNAKRELKLKRKAEKEVEMQKKADEKKRKAKIKQRKQLENEAKNLKMRKPSLKI
nr:uncharacterized protein LOC115265664 [Aedes albopictus]